MSYYFLNVKDDLYTACTEWLYNGSTGKEGRECFRPILNNT